MKTLPIVLHNKKILLIGASNVALQKAEVLHRNKIDFEVISLHVNEQMKNLCKKVTCKAFSKEDIKDFETLSLLEELEETCM